MFILRAHEYPVAVGLVESSMPDWLCLKDECQFEKEPVKVTGLYSLLLLAKALLHAPLFCKCAVAMFHGEKKSLVNYFHGLCPICKHGPSFPLPER